MAAVRGGLVYGVGAVRAAARGDRRFWAIHRAALAHGIVPIVPVGVIAEGFRTEARADRIGDLLDGVEVEPLTAEGAQRIGQLAIRASTADLIATSVAEIAARRNCAVISARQAALGNAATLLGHKLVLHAI
ncbi:MAG: twitching motility protein PilT [Acidimicrobiales bacterium]